MTRTTKSLFILTVIATAIWLSIVYGLNNNATKPLKKDQKVVISAVDKTPTLSAPSASALAVNNGDSHTLKTADSNNITPNLPSIAQLKSKYRIPQERRLEFFKEVFADYQQTPSGYTRVMIANFIEFCYVAPSNEEELQTQSQETEQMLLEAGQSNGVIAENAARLQKIFHECNYIREKTSELSARQLFLEAAYIDNNSRAKMHLVISPMDENYEQWEPVKKAAHIQEMTELIDAARAQCDPFAFLVISGGKNWGENQFWASPEPDGMPKLTGIYANVLAYNLYYANKTSDAKESGLLDRTEARLNRLAAQMSATELQNAKNYGQTMYRDYCAE